MSIVIKDRKYAYLACRSGRRVIHKYLGLVSNPDVAGKIKKLAEEKRVPMKHHYLLWDTDPDKIDLKKNARYVIERVLEAGGLDALQWVQRLYPTKLIIETLEVSRKISPKSKNFWKIWFEANHAF